MVLNLPLGGQSKYLFVLNVLAIGHSPFKDLRPRERDVLAWFYFLNEENKEVPEEHRSKVTFHKDSREMVSKALGITMDNIYNVLVALKKYGLVEGTGDSTTFNTKYLNILGNINDILTFNFK